MKTDRLNGDYTITNIQVISTQISRQVDIDPSECGFLLFCYDGLIIDIEVLFLGSLALFILLF